MQEIACQWCDSTNVRISGHSPVCVETEYHCNDCREKTWHDDRIRKGLSPQGSYGSLSEVR